MSAARTLRALRDLPRRARRGAATGTSGSWVSFSLRTGASTAGSSVTAASLKSGCSQCQIAALGKARRHPRRQLIGLASSVNVAGTFQQVSADRLQPVVVGHALVLVQGADQG